MRPDGRTADQLRTVTLERGPNPYAEGSCLARMGGTLVLCTATVEESVPAWRRGRGAGWLTAEYAMLPRATAERTPRERQGAGGGIVSLNENMAQGGEVPLQLARHCVIVKASVLRRHDNG